MGPATILNYLADLAATALPTGAAAPLDVTRAGEAPAWLGTHLSLPLSAPGEAPTLMSTQVPATPLLARLAALDALQPSESVLRLGWVVLCGTLPVDDRPTTYCLPLLSQPVRLRPTRGAFKVRALGPPELTRLVTDPEVAARLEARVTYGGGALGGHGDAAPGLVARLGGLRGWIKAVVEAAGLPAVTAVLPPAERPADHLQDEGLVACVGALVYVAHDPLRPGLAASLREWAARPHIDATAFGALYADPASGPPAAARRDEVVVSPLRLSEAQRDAVVRARHEPVTVVTGPPGSGKSHTVAAIAADAVAQGRSVLVATRSAHAAGVVADLLARQPGPDVVRFGGTEHDEIVARVAEAGTSPEEIARARADLDGALARRRLVEDEITAALGRERLAEQAGHWDGLVDRLRTLAPTVFDPGCARATLDDLTALAERAGRVVAGAGPAAWWARRRRARATRRLAGELGAAPTTPLVDLCTALECASDRRARAELESRGGTVLAPQWDLLAAADDAVRAAAGRLVAALGASEQRRARGRRAAGDLAAALRAGRRQRHRLLADIDGGAVVAALPLWVGTLRDTEDLLPDTAGLFDLVVLDEASQIDQAGAAGVLLRARRAVVVGDPRQLRHVSFVSDGDVAGALGEHDLGAYAARLDVRRTSVLDLASGRAPATALDEHYRSVPHLIEFSARRFYGGRLQVATRHPANEATDAIDVVRPDPPGGEVAAALAVVERLADEGRRDIAVVTPFRELADAAQEALLARYDVDDIERLGLRAGTVHAFQGAEADHVVLMLGLGPDDAPGRRRFVEDAHLFNVMVTRARRSLVVVTALPPASGPAEGLVEQYLAHADRPPAPPTARACPTSWGDALALELAENGLVVRSGYPVGRWTVDLCIGEGEQAVGVETAVHPRGAAAHLARHRALVDAGWRLVDGFPTRWDHDPTRGAVELATAVPGEWEVAAG